MLYIKGQVNISQKNLILSNLLRIFLKWQHSIGCFLELSGELKSCSVLRVTLP
jgi:hypothetical protein